MAKIDEPVTVTYLQEDLQKCANHAKRKMKAKKVLGWSVRFVGIRAQLVTDLLMPDGTTYSHCEAL